MYDNPLNLANIPTLASWRQQLNNVVLTDQLPEEFLHT